MKNIIFFNVLQNAAAAVFSVLPGRCNNLKDTVDPVIILRSLRSVEEILLHCSDGKFNNKTELNKEQYEKNRVIEKTATKLLNLVFN